jgi:hypothetical protein
VARSIGSKPERAGMADPCWAATAVEKDLAERCLKRGSLLAIIDDIDIMLCTYLYI